MYTILFTQNINNNNYIVCSSTTSNCIECDSQNKCIECSKLYKINSNNQCIERFENCGDIQSTNDLYCYECKTGYYLVYDSNGIIICSDFPIDLSNCYSTSSNYIGGCSKCNSEYHLQPILNSSYTYYSCVSSYQLLKINNNTR